MATSRVEVDGNYKPLEIRNFIQPNCLGLDVDCIVHEIVDGLDGIRLK
jgi:hypothetical protein